MGSGSSVKTWLRPSRRRWSRPAFSNTRRCFVTAGQEIRKGLASSPGVAAPRLRRSRITRRVGSATAANVALKPRDLVSVVIGIESQYQFPFNPMAKYCKCKVRRIASYPRKMLSLFRQPPIIESPRAIWKSGHLRQAHLLARGLCGGRIDQPAALDFPFMPMKKDDTTIKLKKKSRSCFKR
jgi:hypothetical protein